MSLHPKELNVANESRWFMEQVHPHAPVLRSYLKGSFPSVADVDDVVQESMLRVWKTRASQPILCARALLFTVARRLALDHVRRAKASPFETVKELDAVAVEEEGAEVDAVVSTREKIQFLAEAIESLPARCREVVILRKLKGLSQREVAERLGLSEKTVEAHVARGTRRCEAYLMARGVRSYYND